jgi:hypothetical protein
MVIYLIHQKSDEAICFHYEAAHTVVAYLLIKNSDSYTEGGCNHNYTVVDIFFLSRNTDYLLNANIQNLETESHKCIKKKNLLITS